MLRPLIFLIYSNLWIGIGAAAITWQYYLVERLTPNGFIISLAFFSTVLTYTFQRYVKIINKTRSGGDRLEWMKRNPITVKGIMLFSTVGCIHALFEVSLKSYWLLLATGVLSFFYVVKLPGKLGKSLRDIPSLKIFLIGFVWAVIGSFLPYLNLKEVNTEMPWILFISNFIFVIAITIPFDIRDLNLDEDDKRTIPQMVGERKARLIGVGLLLLSALFFLRLTPNSNDLLFRLSILAGLLLIWKSKSNAKDLYFSFAIDGLLILQPLCVYLDLYVLKY